MLWFHMHVSSKRRAKLSQPPLSVTSELLSVALRPYQYMWPVFLYTYIHILELLNSSH